MPESPGKTLDNIIALKARANQQQGNQPSVPSYLFKKIQNTDTNPALRPHDIDLRIDKLIPFKSHPFKLYEGKRFEDMVDSIKTNGVFLPIIVRPVDGSTYEILSGHNRVEAAKAAGLETVPAIIRDGLTDDEAMLIVTETNLLQRSFADLSHSERAMAISTHYDAIKRQGRRTDLIQDIENMLKAHDTGVSEASTPMGCRIKTAEIIGDKYGLCRENVARYVRVNKLINDLKERIDHNEIALRAGVALSYLPENQQVIVEDVLCDGNYKLDMNKADALKTAAGSKPLTHDIVENILKGVKKRKPPVSAGLKLQPKILSKYFKPDQKKTDIENIIVKALDYYFIHHKTEAAEDTDPEI